MALFVRPALFVAKVFQHRPVLFVVLADFYCKIPRFVSPEVGLYEVDMDIKPLKRLKMCD
ncbi:MULTISPECIES: hypothetical protein [Leptolyngbya]|uniref:hypothetical protein n=1 Tax=Leptolyngbya TaxID=47251 RepID=UPI001683167C|nr:hypothetical protein [Leptolyngbya sp. FACHB-1624]MBD1856406.1 hypothetical protein [Leptolyngbya sp. FACHB-1624]